CRHRRGRRVPDLLGRAGGGGADQDRRRPPRHEPASPDRLRCARSRRDTGIHGPMREGAMRMPRIAVLSGLLLLGGTSLAAQTVRGVLTEEGSARPISGALVLLLDADGRQASGSLTDEQGRYQIRASAAGRYTLRIQRIGFTT